MVVRENPSRSAVFETTIPRSKSLKSPFFPILMLGLNFKKSSSSSSLRFNGGLHPRVLHYRQLLDYLSAMLLQLVFRSHILIKPVLIKKLQILFLPCLITLFCSIYFIPAHTNPSLNYSIIILLCSSYLLQFKSTCSMVSNVWQYYKNQ